MTYQLIINGHLNRYFAILTVLHILKLSSFFGYFGSMVQYNCNEQWSFIAREKTVTDRSSLPVLETFLLFLFLRVDERSCLHLPYNFVFVVVALAAAAAAGKSLLCEAVAS